ncbi:MAG: DMT family transporter [Pseudomonadota bacterium]
MISARTPARIQTTASIALVVGGMLWGLYWIPVRFFAAGGLPGPWPGIAMYLVSLVVLLPFLWPDRRALMRNWRAVFFSGLFTGAAFSLFTTSLVYTDVVRSILLFYLAPIWGTLLGLVFLGERLTLVRVIGLIVGLAGLIVILGGEQMIPGPRNLGDWLALASGLAWSIGSLGLYRTTGVSLPIQVFAFVVGAVLISIAGVVLAWGGGAALPEMDAVAGLAPYAVLSVIYVLPMLFLTIWPATKLTPARVGLLLMSEVVVGLATAALFAGEPFGWREGVGAALIVGAAVLEITRG